MTATLLCYCMVTGGEITLDWHDKRAWAKADYHCPNH
jgi:hypothetical protein